MRFEDDVIYKSKNINEFKNFYTYQRISEF